MLRIGVDLGGTNIVVGLVDENYDIAGKAWTPTRSEKGIETVVSDIENCIENVLAFSGYRFSECSGIGIGTPGSCDSEKGIARSLHNLGIADVPICEMLTEKLGLPAFLENDANCAALGEVIAGAAKSFSSALMITLGTGVGGGFVIDGKIYSGHKSLGGEFGHTCIAVDGLKCACGEKGCWEAYASAPALVRQAKAAALNTDSALNNFENPDGKDVFEAAEKGDKTAINVLNKYFEYVGIGIVNMINCVYPEIILIGGGISEAGDMLINGVRDYVYNHCFIKDKDLLPKIVKAKLGNDAGIIGAAALVNMN